MLRKVSCCEWQLRAAHARNADVTACVSKQVDALNLESMYRLCRCSCWASPSPWGGPPAMWTPPALRKPLQQQPPRCKLSRWASQLILSQFREGARLAFCSWSKAVSAC